MDQLVIVVIILETIVLSKMCLVLLVTAFKVGFPKISKLLLPYLQEHLPKDGCQRHADLHNLC